VLAGFRNSIEWLLVKQEPGLAAQSAAKQVVAIPSKSLTGGHFAGEPTLKLPEIAAGFAVEFTGSNSKLIGCSVHSIARYTVHSTLTKPTGEPAMPPACPDTASWPCHGHICRKLVARIHFNLIQTGSNINSD